ncbi:LysM peptidoglycan-binding domain-containing protein [Trinickia terrae]|uniref:LysM peptidoglycan-binding domain-containing protein n=1 Tax=Trinickia terrae TaxID=2571161 RepID=A0A4U1I7X4_9BURK|nr:LysM peptidoglycan-binding domain-containing protein [Trinickia terrae]TKC89437.1 LysM peptidoglycan-binding domain-containing protein [Trinickia terrae]
MVAIVTGYGLGMQYSSGLGLGARGQIGSASFGQNGERIYVNAATGNLAIQDLDQMLLGQGVNSNIYRAYNSSGSLGGANGNWLAGGAKRVGGLDGRVNAQFSQVTLTGWDGSQVVYTYDVSRKLYVTTVGVGADVSTGAGVAQVTSTGARATLTFDAALNTWIWRSGDNTLIETYDGATGRLSTCRDRDGNTVFYTYNSAGALSQVKTQSGDSTYLDYDAAGKLAALRTVYRDTASQLVTATAVRYAYDSQGRLSRVTVDLSPEDNSVADGRVFTTTYTYDGTSNRIASIAQSDGSLIKFSYEWVFNWLEPFSGGDMRVSRIEQIAGQGEPARVTTLSYDTFSRRTTITDPLGQQQQLTYDNKGRLLELADMSSGSAIDRRQTFTYDVYGNVTAINGSDGRWVKFTYDAANNVVQQWGSEGVIYRTYGANNELLSEKVGQDFNTATSQFATTRYVYDKNGHRRFAISAEGRVTEFRYNAAGQAVSELHYSGSSFAASTSAPTEAQLETWVAALADKSAAARVDMAYDYRGNVALVTRYGKLRADGEGDADAGEITQVRYVYDAFGRLLQRFAGAPGSEQVEQFTYDGLGRLLTAVHFDGTVTQYQRVGDSNTVSVTFANGLTRVSTYNGAGELIAVDESSAAHALLSHVENRYDAKGRLRMTIDANGGTTHYLYDRYDRRTAEVGPDGTARTFEYDSAGFLAKTITYSQRLTAAQLGKLVQANGRPVDAASLAAAGISPSTGVADQVQWTYYRNGLLEYTVDAYGYVVRYQYDSSGRLLSRTAYGNSVSTVPRPDPSKVTANASTDRTTRYIYDLDGLLLAEIDADSYLVQHRYNSAGQRTETIRHAGAAGSAVTDLASLLKFSRGTGAPTILHTNLYDARGFLRAEIDGEGYVTSYQYDAFGNVSERVRGRKLTVEEVRSPQQVPLTIEASGTPGESVEAWIDGVKAGSVVLTQAGYASYSLTASNIVPISNHTIELRSAGGKPVEVRRATFGGLAFVAETKSIAAAGERYTLEAAQVALAQASTPGALERTVYVYDAMGRLQERSTYSVTGSATSRYTYDSQGNLIRETTGNRTSAWRYDEQGRLIGQLNGKGSEALAALGSEATQAQIDAVWQSWGVRYAYDANGNRISMTDANGNVTYYYYGKANRLTLVINALGEVTRYQTGARSSSESDRTITTVYGQRLSQQTLATLTGGQATDALWQAINAVSGGDNLTTLFEYDQLGQLTRRTDFASDVGYRYNAFGDVLRQTTQIAAGERLETSFDYDKRGNRISRTDFYDKGNNSTNLSQTKTDYDAFGRPITWVDANGGVRRQSYDRNGNVIVIADAESGQTKLTYDAFGNALTRTDRTGNTTQYAYDGAKRQVRVTTPEGISTVTTYDEFGQVVALTDGRGNTTTYRYDLDGKLVETKAPQGTTTQAFDHAGQLIETVDGRGTRTRYTYDAAGRVLTRVVDPTGLNLVTRYEYDAKGQVVRVTDPSGAVTETAYDVAGRTASVTVDAGEGGLKLVTQFVYDQTGNVVTVIEGRGTNAPRTTKKVYDGLGRLTESIADPDGLKLKTTYTYDRNGNVVAVTDPGGNVTRYVYDKEGRRTWSVDATGAVTRTMYDPEGRVMLQLAHAQPISLTGLPTPLGESDIEGRLTLMPERDQSTAYAYDKDGRLRYTVNALGYVTEQTCDASGNVTATRTYARALDVSQARTLAGIASALGAQGAKPTVAEYVTKTYDAANRLIETIVDPDGVKAGMKYTYDANGNLLTAARRTALGGVNSYAYDAAGRQTWAIDAEGAITRNVYDGAGRLVTRQAFANTLWFGYYEQLPANFGESEIASLVKAWPERDRTTSYVYDGASRLRYEVNALNYVTERVYDAAGNVVSTIAYAGAISVTGEPSAASVAAALKAQDATTHASDRVTRNVFDAANRLLFSVNAMGYVTQNRYDANGNLLERVAYRTPYGGEGTPTQADLQKWLASPNVPDAAGDRTTTWLYDSAGRQVYLIDAEGYVTEKRYDFAGRVLKTIRYAGQYEGARTATLAQLAARLPATLPADAAMMESRYDAAGGLTETVNAAGIVTRHTLDAAGRASETEVAYGTKEASVTRREFDAAGNMTRETRAYGTAAQTTTLYNYGWSGLLDFMVGPRGVEAMEQDTEWALAERRALGLVDAKGEVLRAAALTAEQKRTVWLKYGTFYSYDKLGRQNGVKVGAGGFNYIFRASYDAFGNAVTRSENGASAGTFFFDKLDRVILAVNDAGGATRTEYGASGQPVRITQYVQPIFNWSPGTQTLYYAISETPGKDAVTQLEYDRLDRLVKSTDAEGYFETYAYDALGNRTNYKNKLGGTFTYTYDRRGLKLSETLPVTSRGNSVVNRFEYDARGNLVATTEATGLAEQRITRYAYDALDRQISKTGVPVTVTQADGTTKTVTPVERFVYDARGNVIKQIDANGSTATSYYDAANRKTGQVSATGTLTLWAYDAAGNVVTQQVFAKPVESVEGSTPPAALVANLDQARETNQLRETRYKYNLLNQMIESRVMSVATGDFKPDAGADQKGEYIINGSRSVEGDASERYISSDLVTKYEYDGAGRVISKTDPRGFHTYSFYDRVGNKIFEAVETLQPNGKIEWYGTSWTRDANGNVTEEVRFATTYKDPITTSSMSYNYALRTNWPRSAEDRVTLYEWDRNGRLVGETHTTGVRYEEWGGKYYRDYVPGARVDANGKLTEGAGVAKTRYAYDGEGHLVRKTDALGNQHDFTYDALGRQTGQILPQFFDYLNRNVRASTSYEYDGLNNVVRETKGGDGQDQVTAYAYGEGGRLLSKTNALGVVTGFGYDAAGNTTLVGYLRGDVHGQQVQEKTTIVYDAASREVSRITRSHDVGSGAALASGALREQQYNAFGEIVARRTGGGGANGQWQEYADYNNAGWVVRTNFGDGISHLYMHDRNGNATLKVESMSSDLRGRTLETGQDLLDLLKEKDMMQTYTLYDSRNQVVRIQQPKTSAGAPRVSFAPVDIDIDGGVFAETQLKVGGWVQKSTTVVAPELPLHAGDVGIIGGDGVAKASVDWSTIAAGGQYILRVESISISLPDLSQTYGAYGIEVRVSSALTGTIFALNGPEQELIEVRVNESVTKSTGYALNNPTNFTVPTEFYVISLANDQSELSLSYTAEIFLTPLSGAGGASQLIGTINKTALLVGVLPTGRTDRWGSPIYAWGRADLGAPTADTSLALATNTLSVARGTLPDDAQGMLYYRRAGSNENFQLLPKSANSQPKSYMVDTSGLPDGDYDMIFIAVKPDGTLLRRDGLRTHISHSGSSSVETGKISYDQQTFWSSFTADATGNYVWTAPQTLNMYALRSSTGALADHVQVRVRRFGQGENDWVTRTLYRDGGTGAMSLAMSDFGAGDYEVEIDLLDANGNRFDQLRGDVYLRGGNQAPSFSFDYVSNAKSSVEFSAQPADTDYLIVSWEQDGETHYTKVPKEGDTFVWDTLKDGLIPDPWRARREGLSYTYPIKFTAYDAFGVPLSMGQGSITVSAGTGDTTQTLTGSSRPTIFEFSPTDDHGQPLTEADSLTLYYRPAPKTQKDYDAPFQTIVIKRNAAGRFLFDATELPTKTEYEYRYVAFDKDGKAIAERESYFLTGTRNNPVTNVDVIGMITETAKDMTIDRHQRYNAFGEVSAERDGRGNWTYLSYNVMGKLVLKREPKISVTLSDGTKTEVAPETRFYYDLLGNLVGMKDANGHLSTQQWNHGLEQPAVSKSWDALGYSKTFGYDAHGNLRAQTDELGRRTDYTYDAENRLIQIERPSIASGANAGRRATDRYEYDSAGNRIAHTGALGGRETTYYDNEGRIVRTVSAAGRAVQYTYEWASEIATLGTAQSGGWRKTTTNANGMSMVDELDLFGRVTKRTDLGGHVFSYEYNWAGQVTKQTGTSGQHVEYEYYSNGLVRSIKDYGTQTESFYEYDGDGNRTAEFFRSFGAKYLFAQSRVTYDAANRVTAIKDDAYQVYYEYDAVGNRRRMRAEYTDLVGYHKKTQDYWYEYDALNRFTVTMGVLQDGRIVKGAKGGEGVQLAYNGAGERVLASYASDERTERYEYDANGYLTNQSINGVVVRERKTDLLGRVTAYSAYTADRASRTEAVTREYDADGLQRSERDLLGGATTTYTRMADGTLSKVERKPDSSSGTSTTSTYEYEWWDGAKQKRVTSQGTNPNAPGWKPASSYFNYDVNGNLKSTYDDGGGQQGKARAFTYWTDLQGQVQRRDELVGVTVAADGTITGAMGDRKHNYYYLNGHRVGNVGNDGVEKVDYVQELAGKLGKGSESQFKVFTPISTADFDENYMAINGTYPGISPGTWTVRDGDTLRSIASTLWGDETLWYLLAEANGLKSTDELRAGQLLQVPNKVTNVHNTATTFKPYDPGQAIGNTQPTLPDPPPPPSKGGGCGGFIKIIAVVVAVVASVVSVGAGSLLGAALIGAAGSVASQGIMILGGEQKGFNWKQVGMSAVASATTAGMGAAASSASGFASAAAVGAASSAVTQGIGVATGLQNRFDWKSVAASGIAAGVGSQVGAQVGKAGMSAGWSAGTTKFVSGVSAGVAGGTAGTLARGGSLGRDVGVIAATAFASSTVGNMVVDSVQANSIGKTDRTQQAIENMNAQVLPAGLGGVNSGFVAPETAYSSNAALFGTYGGLVNNSQTPYSGAAALFGPSSGVAASQKDSHAIALADSGGNSEALLYAWDRAKQYGSQGWSATKQFAYDMAGATSMDAARANWSAGNYGTAIAKGAQSFAEAATTVFTFGNAATLKSGLNALVNGGKAVLASEALGGGSPIFSSGGLLGSRMWASSVGTGAISAGINAGAQYLLTGDINPVDVAVIFGTGTAGSFGGLRWNMGVNAFGGMIGTATNNYVYKKEDSIVGAGVTTGALSSFGYGIGKLGERAIASSIRPSLTSNDWAATGVWSGAGWNLLNPNRAPVVAGSFGGASSQEITNAIYLQMQSQFGSKK